MLSRMCSVPPSTSSVGKFILYGFVHSVWNIHLGMSPNRITLEKNEILKAMPSPAPYCFEVIFLYEMLYSFLYSILHIT